MSLPLDDEPKAKHPLPPQDYPDGKRCGFVFADRCRCEAHCHATKDFCYDHDYSRCTICARQADHQCKACRRNLCSSCKCPCG